MRLLRYVKSATMYGCFPHFTNAAYIMCTGGCDDQQCREAYQKLQKVCPNYRSKSALQNDICQIGMLVMADNVLQYDKHFRPLKFAGTFTH